jgi:hypothetical protein
MGPIVGGSHGWPFAAAGPGRLPEGYVEEEYFIEGDAVQYALAPGGGRLIRHASVAPSS